MPNTQAPTPQRVAAIASMTDPVARNLAITEAYHDLSSATARILGDNATWATFGCWASKTAGAYIRGDELPAILHRAVAANPTVHRHAAVGRHGAPEQVLQDIRDTVERAAAEVGVWLAEGNRVVFAEMGAAFAAFVQAFTDGAPEEAALDRLVAGYTAGPPLPDRVHRSGDGTVVTGSAAGGQDMLADMLRCYCAAARETDPKRKAELILCGNAFGGVHEQTRLQTYIIGSLDAPLTDLIQHGLHRPATSRQKGSPAGLRHRLDVALARLTHPLGSTVEHLWRCALTLELMSMHLPDAVLRLGRDLPAPPGGPAVPAQLTDITLPELGALLDRYHALHPARPHDRPDGLASRLAHVFGHPGGCPALAGSAAEDWSALPQRMRFILELFRSRQQDPRLATAPFTGPQEDLIEVGRIPAGRL
jgi:hypothetical protein